MNNTSSTATVVSFWADIRRTLWLAIPIIISQVLGNSASIVDALLASRVGDLAFKSAGAVGAFFFIVLLGCIGLINGLSPIFAKLIGENKPQDIGLRFRQGIMYGSIACLLGFFVTRWIAANLDFFNIQPRLIPLGSDYLYAVSWTYLVAPITLVTRSLLEATEQTRTVMFVTTVGLAVNVVCSIILGLGYLGLPKLGLQGIGYATAISFLVMSLLSWRITFSPIFAQYCIHERWRLPQPTIILPMLSISIPISLMLLAEAGLFAASSIQAAQISEVASGAHYIALQAISLLFMPPLGLSFIIVARVGRAYGEQNIAAIRQRIISGVAIATVMAILNILILLGLTEQIIDIYHVTDARVAVLASSLMIYAAIFQVSDTTQALCTGSLRGLHDTKVPMFINIFSFWGLGFPSGFFCAHFLKMGAQGLWIGLIIGLTASGILLSIRLYLKLRRLEREFILATPQLATTE